MGKQARLLRSYALQPCPTVLDYPLTVCISVWPSARGHGSRITPESDPLLLINTLSDNANRGCKG